MTDQRTFIHVAEINQHRILTVTILAASLLILINLAGGMKLLVTLRRMRAGPQASPHLGLDKASFDITLVSNFLRRAEPWIADGRLVLRLCPGDSSHLDGQ